MCGLVGLFDARGREGPDARLLQRMADAIAHRGPDGEGFHVEPGLGLGHRRLAIIDIGGGGQPMSTPDGRLTIVFNGEIYNFRELRSELSDLGFVFRTQSDTEVILNAWLAWGGGCIARFNGMFAFALWDASDETLILARDRIGKKPLYYARDGARRMAFASELKALLLCPWIGRELSPHAVEDYFCYGYVPDPKSIYQNILKLPPAHSLTWRRGEEPRLACYWDLDLPDPAPVTLDHAAAELHDRLRTSVRRRLIADVPLGAFLSGGVDSSGIVAHMASMTDTPVRTTTIGFGESSHDERMHARALAARYGTDHSEAVLSANVLADSPEQLDLITSVYDEPFADSSSLPTYRVCAIARQRVTVALSGDGGDEVFAGYRRYLWHIREHAARTVLPQALRGPLFGLMARIYPRLDRAPRIFRARSTFEQLAQDAAGAYSDNLAVASAALRRRIFSPRFHGELQGYSATAVISGLMSKAPSDRPLLQAQYADMKTWLAGRMLVKVDRASMAHGLEVRNPYLDHDLVQWAVTLPDDLKLRGGRYKRVLKKSLEPLVPHDLLYRPKQGFSVPMGQWLRGPLQPLLRRALESPALLETGYFQPRFLDEMLRQHIEGSRDFGAPLWALIVFERFLSRSRPGD